jgi:energy-converting hydrogenase A subunit G
LLLVAYGLVLSGFTGGAIAGLGVIFYVMAREKGERFELVEMASGITWAVWILAFFIFMFFPMYWYMALMLAAIAILLKVTAKLSLMGSMWGGRDE